MAEPIHVDNADFRARQEELMHQMSKRIARRVDRELFEREMTHKDFAALINHSQGVVSRWLNGKHNFTLSTLAMISLVLDIDVLEP
ncbi:MAG: helix-turn-helix domain-containing protein [Muribaculaceae bacterium]|nr:helix-turn-helix domain-containing protein [Muribaculaceae bacterium]